MTRCTHWLALAALAIFPMTVSAFWLRPRSVPTATSSYYYLAPAIAVPVIVVPVVEVPAPVCVPQAPGTFAVPTPAPAANELPPMPPASGMPNPAPPAGAPRPAVSESAPSTSYYAGPGASPDSPCAVVFWNYTDRDLTLTIDGQRRLLLRSKGVTLELPRAFTWQTDARTPQQEMVRSEHSGMEIVIRR